MPGDEDEARREPPVLAGGRGARAAERVLEPRLERVACRAEPSHVELGGAEERVGVERIDRERSREGEPGVVEPAEGGERLGTDRQRLHEPRRQPERLLRAGDRAERRLRLERVASLLGEDPGRGARLGGEAARRTLGDPLTGRGARAHRAGRGGRRSRSRRAGGCFLASAGPDEEEPNHAAERADHARRELATEGYGGPGGGLHGERGSGGLVGASPRGFRARPSWTAASRRAPWEHARHAQRPRRRRGPPRQRGRLRPRAVVVLVLVLRGGSARRRAAPPEPPPAHLRRRERRGVLQLRREGARVPVDA